MSLTLLGKGSPTLVFSRHEENKAFLEIVQQGDRVRVVPTPLGRFKLNRFWPMWLRQLILDKTDHQHGFTVELYGDYVVVSSNTTLAGLRATVNQLAAEIRPLADNPLRRWSSYKVGTRSYGPIFWAVERPGLPIAMIIDSIPLPSNADLQFIDGDPKNPESLRLKHYAGLMSGREMGMLVELYFTLACST